MKTQQLITNISWDYYLSIENERKGCEMLRNNQFDVRGLTISRAHFEHIHLAVHNSVANHSLILGVD